MKAYIFPGQGSQIKGMGLGLFEQFPELTAAADHILGYSIKTLCLDDPKGVLNKTQFTQPALYVVNALMYFSKLKNGQAKPNYLAGHSLGEYNALLAAGVIDFEMGLRLVQQRGQLMSQALGGAMAAILNCDDNIIQSIIKTNNLHGIDIANFNSPNQIVIAGPTKEIELAKPLFTQAGAVYIPLNVSAAFHSRYMEKSANEFGHFLHSITFSEPNIPVISNVSASPYLFSEIRNNLKNQISHSVQWTDSIRYLLSLGVTTFEEIGPGDVLTKLVKSIQSVPIPMNYLNKKQTQKHFSAEKLGSNEFKKAYNIRYAYLTGAMVKGIASKEHVVRMGKAGLMGYFGTGGLNLRVIEDAIKYIQKELPNGESYGMNLLYNLENPGLEMKTVDLFLKYGISCIEAAAYIQLNAAIVKYKLTGLSLDSQGKVNNKHKILAKISRPEVADIFLNPPSERIVEQLLNIGAITSEQAKLSQKIPIADDICVEADSGGHTDMGIVSVILPTIIRQRDEVCQRRGYSTTIRVGTAGGIGTPESAAAAFVLGAEFIMTGSINQCTVDAGTSDEVKDMLAQLNVQDTDYAPAGDMFEIGAKIQVMRKGVFFPARANKLYDLWSNHNSWEEIDLKTREQIEKRYFGRSFEDVYNETKEYYLETLPIEIEKAERNPRHKLALVFKWYFIHTARLALKGDKTDKVNYQVHVGPAMGAFNQWVKGTEMERWQNRYADIIADKIMHETAELLSNRFYALIKSD